MRLGIISVAAALCFFISILPVHQADAQGLLRFRAQTASERNLLISILGSDFGAFGAMGPPALQIAKYDLNSDGVKDVVAYSSCTNHTCDFEILITQNGTLQHVATLTSWGLPYVSKCAASRFCDIIIFSEPGDCATCSSPRPVRMTWSARAFGPHRTRGTYIKTHRLSTAEARNYPVNWD